MLACFASSSKGKVTPIVFVAKNEYLSWLTKQSGTTQNWLKSADFRPEIGCSILIPDVSGKLLQALCIVDAQSFWVAGALPMTLPEGQYTLQVSSKEYSQYAIAWGLGAYQFDRYKKPKRKSAQLVIPKTIDSKKIHNIVESIYLVRDLINTPTDDMGPTELSAAAAKLSKKYHAKFKQIVGEDLLKQNYPSIYTVGRASDDKPRLLDMRWGNVKHPKVTLVGKGVCFDTGGLNIKPGSGMTLMKKDMGGAAHVLGLARMIMEAKLPIRLRVLIPAVENAINGNAYRPGDVITSRKGTTIEISNTDAEGRVVLADALTEAVSEKPALLIDMATLTGAARIALGTDLPAAFSNHNATIIDLIKQAELVADPIWRLPLFAPYRELLNSPIADINNSTADGYAGAITAALFLQEFVPQDIPWLHFDVMAWNLRTRPGRPQGGEAVALRALFAYLSACFSK